MLEAIYHNRVRQVTLEEEYISTGGEISYEIDTDELPEGLTYQIIGYSKVGCYTLTVWQLSDGEEAIAGESLWFKNKPIITGGGQLPLFIDNIPDARRSTANIPANIWDENDHGELVCPDAIGKALRRSVFAIADADKIYS